MHSFKRTLWKALAFLLAVGAATALITEPYFQNEGYHYQDDAVREQLAGELDTMICGSSHAYYGIVPAVLDEKLGTNSYNLSAPMMTLQGRYELLKKELDRNPVDLVFVDVSFNTFSRDRAEEGPEGDIYQLGRYRNVLERMSYLVRNIRFGEYAHVYSDTLDRGVTVIRKLLRGEGKTGTSDKYETKGWMRGESIAQYMTPPEYYHTQVLDTTVRQENLDCMDKIIDLCRERGITVVFVVTPISQSSTLRYDNMDAIHSSLTAYCAGQDVPLFDFNLYKGKTALYPDETAYYDASHLAEGAAQDFTALMCDTLLQWQAGEDVSGQFYASYAAAEEAALAGLDVPPVS